MKSVMKNKKGFTLIEIVIVIVIIAILAAILVPSLLSWIDKARQRTVLSEADTLRNTVTAEMLEIYKDGIDVDGTQTSAAYDATFWANVSEKAGKTIQGSDSAKENYLTFTVSDGKLTGLTYTTGGVRAIFDGKDWTSEKAD